MFHNRFFKCKRRELCYFRSFPSLSIRHKFQSVPLITFLGIFVNKGGVPYWANSTIYLFFASQILAKWFAISFFWRWSHWTSILKPKLHWHIRQSQTHLPLFKDKEKFLLQLLGKNWSSSNDYLCIFRVFVEFCISFSAKQGSVFYIVGTISAGF